jgi:TRAP-type C4-dicarboxylate transport system permease small subunit
MKILTKISDYLRYVAMFTVTALMLLTVADIFMRYIFSNPITGVTELTENGMVVMVFLSLAAVTVLRKHISVDLVMERLSPKVQNGVEIGVLTLTVATLFIMSWRSYVEAVINMRKGIESSLLELPESPFRYILAVGLTLVTIVALIQLIQSIAKAVKR